MYFDGLSSVTGKEGTWNARKHQYAKTLVESRTMESDINIVYNMIIVMCLMYWHAWIQDESVNLDFRGQLDV